MTPHAEPTVRHLLIKLPPVPSGLDIWAVVDADTGAYYGVVEAHIGRDLQTDAVTHHTWGARDWQSLSLGNPSDYRAPTTADGWAERLVARADKAGGVPQPDDPELAPGLYDGFLYLRSAGSQTRFRVYTPDGRSLGAVLRDDDGLWHALYGRGAEEFREVGLSGLRVNAAHALLTHWHIDKGTGS